MLSYNPRDLIQRKEGISGAPNSHVNRISFKMIPLNIKYGLDRGYASVSVDIRLISVPDNVIRMVTKSDLISAASCKIIL
jgi:hypothetical protein